MLQPPSIELLLCVFEKPWSRWLVTELENFHLIILPEAPTFIPSTALVVKIHDLGNEKLRKCLVMRNTGQHFTEFSNY